MYPLSMYLLNLLQVKSTGQACLTLEGSGAIRVCLNPWVSSEKIAFGQRQNNWEDPNSQVVKDPELRFKDCKVLRTQISKENCFTILEVF